MVALILLLGAPVPALAGSSPGSSNREGNRLYADRKYEEAEKAYLEARAREPERPELDYNLGNALLRQKKYDDAAQSLRNAVARADRSLQARSWYNLGNGHFEAGRFQDAAQAYVEALKLAPADRDAKHNLELARRKLQEQAAQKPDKSGGGQRRDQPQPQPPQGGKQEKQPEQQSQQQREQQQAAGDRPEQAAQPQSTRPDRRQEGFSRDQAMEILDALQNQELADQRKRIERRTRRKTTGRDW